MNELLKAKIAELRALEKVLKMEGVLIRETMPNKLPITYRYIIDHESYFEVEHGHCHSRFTFGSD